MSYLDKDVALRKTLGEMVEDRNEAVNLWAQGYRVLEMSEKKVKDVARYGGPRMYDVASPDKARHEIDKAFWRAAFERTRMMEIMDSKARKEFDNALERKPPVFSLDNIESQYVTMYQGADEMFLRGIYEVFRHLDESYWNNSHEPYQLSEKSILRGILDSWSTENSWTTPHLSYHRTDLLNDIDRCVKVLTGRKHQPRELETKINAALKDQDGPPWVYEDDDYHMKFFKNCNCHLTFKNQDTIDRLNRAIAQYCNHHKLKEAA
jgi:hypothetical protein